MARQFGVSKNKKAIFITFEGSEGCGKSSLIDFLSSYLRRRKYRVKVFREPGSTKIGERIREILLDKKNKEMGRLTELLLYLACRSQLIQEKLIKTLEENDFVICDRFSDSTLVYQGYALGLGKVVDKAVDIFSLGVKPDLTFWLDSDVRSALKRVKRKDRIESRSLLFHEKLRKGYRILQKKYPARIKRINADVSLDKMKEELIAQFNKYLWRRKINLV